MSETPAPALAIRGFQIRQSADDPSTKCFSILTSEGHKFYFGTRETLLRIGQELVKAAEAMPKPS